MNIFKRAINAIRPKGNVVDAKAPTINIVDKSTLMDAATFAAAVEACKIQLEQHVAPMWLRGSWNIVVNQPETPQHHLIVITDDADHANALGYHTQSPNGQAWGRVFVKPVMKNGGSMLSGSLSVSTVLSHEVIELYCNPFVNSWVDTHKGHMIVHEACDPVENDSYVIKTSKGVDVSVSNFVLPDWFNPFAPAGTKLDFMAVLSKPFQVSPKGYVVMRNSKTGEVRNVFGSVMAEELHGLRQEPHPASRSTRMKCAAESLADEENCQ